MSEALSALHSKKQCFAKPLLLFVKTEERAAALLRVCSLPAAAAAVLLLSNALADRAEGLCFAVLFILKHTKNHQLKKSNQKDP